MRIVRLAAAVAAGALGYLSSCTVQVPRESQAESEVTGTRLRAIWVVGDDGTKERLSGKWYDAELGVNCVAAVASDGVVRCLPAIESGNGALHAGIQLYDSLCQAAIAAVDEQCRAPRFVLTPLSHGCGDAWHVYPVTGRADPAVVRLGGPDRCLVAPIYDYLSYYSLGAESPAETFVALTQSH